MDWGWRPYVSVAERRAQARSYAAQLAKEGRTLQPVEKIAGRAIAKTFWGRAWCENLERYSDFANRLPRGRTYVRNGSVIDLQMAAGNITALVSGSEIYEIEINISCLSNAQWEKIQRDCSQSIESLMDLLQGRFSQGVMERLTRPKEGLFPQPREIEMSCSCPDWAGLCKHLAAVLYGVGARLDTSPELLFLLRRVNHLDLIDQAVDQKNLDQALGAADADSLAGEDLSELFGIDLETEPAAPSAPPKSKRRKPAARSSSASARAPKKITAKKQAAAKNAGAEETAQTAASKKSTTKKSRAKKTHAKTASTRRKSAKAKKKSGNAPKKRAK